MPRVKKVRQRFSVIMGWFGVAVGLILAAAQLGDPRSNLPMLCAGLTFAALSYCVLARPYFAVTNEHVIASNVVREVSIPWEGLSHATSRGSLVLHDNDGHKTTVWSIGSQKAKATRSGEGSGRVSWRPAPGDLQELPTSSRALVEGLNAEVVDNPSDVPANRSVRWLPVPSLLMTGTVALIVAAILL